MPNSPTVTQAKTAATKSLVAYGDACDRTGYARGLAAGQAAASPPVEAWDYMCDFSDPAAFDKQWRREACQWGSGEAPFTTATDLAYVKDGLGYVVARRRPGGNIEGGLVNTIGKFTMSAGVVEARLKAPTAPGSFAAAWLIDAINGGAHSEIDIVETVGSELGYATVASIHNWVATNKPNSHIGLGWPYLAHRPIDPAAFHTYRLEWDAYSISVSIDGRTAVVWNQDMWKTIYPDVPWVFGQKPLALVLDCTVGGSWAGPATKDTPDEVQLIVDYVRARKTA